MTKNRTRNPGRVSSCSIVPTGGPALHTAALTFLTLGNKSPENTTPIGPSFPIQLAIRLKSHHTYQSRKCINPCPVLQIENDGSYRDLQYTRKQSECKYIQDKRKYRWNKMKPLDLLSWKQLTEKKKSGFEININVRSKKKKSLPLTNFSLCKGILPTSICVLSGTLVNLTSGTATAHMTWAHLQERRH